jgi:festuclavine dehydrogenase
MTILLTGSTGKTTTLIAHRLEEANIPYLIATRREPSELSNPSTKFDWFHNKTWTTTLEQHSDISAVYIVSPEVPEPGPIVNKFIDLAMSKGVKKFILVGGTSIPKGGPFTGAIWAHLDQSGAEYAILRPSWFMENFSKGLHDKTIKEESVFYSATQDGKMPFVAANDIAEAGFTILSGKAPYGNRDYFILGPELLNHDQVAGIFTQILGREVKHVRKSAEEMTPQYLKVGVAPLFANFTPYGEVGVSQGSDEALKDDFEGLVGRKGITFKEWAEQRAKEGTW